MQNVYRFDGIRIHPTGRFLPIGLFKNNVCIDIRVTWILKFMLHHHYYHRHHFTFNDKVAFESVLQSSTMSANLIFFLISNFHLSSTHRLTVIFQMHRSWSIWLLMSSRAFLHHSNLCELTNQSKLKSTCMPESKCIHNKMYNRVYKSMLTCYLHQ